MADKDEDSDYLEKLKQVDGQIKQRLDNEFGQLRVIAIACVVIALLLVVGRRIFGF